MPLARVLTASSTSALLLVVLLLSASAPAACHVSPRNVTAILSARRGLTEFSRALTATGLADVVNNTKDPVTVLAVDDARMAKTRGLPRVALCLALSRHVLAGYHDDASLRRLMTLTDSMDVVAPTLLDSGAAGAVKIIARQGQGRGAGRRVAFVPLDDTRAAAASYVGPVVHEAPRNNVSVLLVSGVMWAPPAAHPEPRLLDPSTAPADQGPSSRAGASRLVSRDADAVTPTTQSLQAPIDVARSSSATAPRGRRMAFAPHQDGARATVLPAQQVTPDTRGVSALQEEEGGVSSPAAEAASPPEPRPGPDDSAAAPSPSAPPDRALDASVFTIFGILMVCYLVVCCCSSQQPDA